MGGGGGNEPGISSQRHMIDRILWGFMDEVGQPGAAYEGQLWGGPSPIQENLYGAYGGVDPNALLGAQTGALTGAMGGQPGQTYAGISPIRLGHGVQTGLWGGLSGTETPGVTEAAQQYFQQSVADPATQRFREEIMPAVRHAQAVGGTSSTGAGLRAQERMATDLAGELGQSQAQFAYQQQEAARNRALQAAQVGGGLLGQISGEEAAARERALQAAQLTGGTLGQAGQVGEQMRTIGQAPLDIEYEQWQRQQPYANPILPLLASVATQMPVMPGGGGLFK